MKQKFRAPVEATAAHLERSRAGRFLLRVAARLAARLIIKRSVDFRRVHKCWFRLDGGAMLPIGKSLKLYGGSMMSWELHGEEIYRPRRKWWFRYYTPSAGDIIVDVGAGRGEDAFIFSREVGTFGKVVAVEAHPETFAILRDFVRLNRLENVSLENYAVCDKEGAIFITQESEELWQCASVKRSSGAGIRVTARRIDDLPLVKKASSVAFMKINIEGAEVEALHGASETLAKTQSVCICCHDFLGEDTRTKDAVKELLLGRGFKLRCPPAEVPPYERDFVYGTR